MMDDASSPKVNLPENILQSLFNASSSSSQNETLEILVEEAKTPNGRSKLADKNIILAIIQLIHSLSYPSDHETLLLSLKLIRNLCAGEILNQNTFIEEGNILLISSVLNSMGFESESECGIFRMGLQLLGNVCLGGEKHQGAVWEKLFPNWFLKIAGIHKREICDPLCMIIFTCSDGSHERFVELCGDHGLHIMAEIVRTTSTVGFGEDWFKLLLSRICIDESHFPQLFSTINPFDASENIETTKSTHESFVSEQAHLLKIMSEILNERLMEITFNNDFSLYLFKIFKRSLNLVDFSSRSNSNLPTGSTAIDILGYSITILRDICSLKCTGENSLLSSGFLDTLICILRHLEPPSMVKKAMKQQSTNQEENTTSTFSRCCPYKGFRRDIIAVIGNCAYRNKRVQDEIREKNAIILILQQCVSDEENPFLREWGIWASKNLLEGNVENQRVVSELELQDSVDVPELAGLGLRVEVDKKAGRAKLVNVS